MQAAKLVYCYAHEDNALRDELAKHLTALKRLGLIIEWYDQDIHAGGEWQKEIDNHLNAANIILLLISPDFIHSEYCYSVEMQKSLERHYTRKARVIPIILRAVIWEGMPFSKLQALPIEGRPITTWLNRDEAFSDVVRGIKKTIEEFLPESGTQNTDSKEIALHINHRLEYLAVKIDDIDQQVAAQLRSLGKDIRDDVNLSTWEKADVYRIIDVDRVIERFQDQYPKESTLLRCLRFGRNLLIFAPLLFIIFDAFVIMDAYQRVVSWYPSALRVSFLLLWEGGFHRILPDFACPPKAFLCIFILILFLVITIVMIEFLDHSLKMRKKNSAKHLRNDILASLVEASDYLRSQR